MIYNQNHILKHPAGTSSDSVKYDTIQSFWHDFIMVVYEKIIFKVFERNEEICIKTNIE